MRRLLGIGQGLIGNLMRVLFVSLLLASGGLPLAQAEALPGWSASDEQSTQVVDHAGWQNFLNTFLHTDSAGQTFLDYARVTPPHRIQLAAYLTELQAIDPLTLNRAEQQAYWINLYNAATVEVVLGDYPVKSIRAIGGAFGGLIPTGPWSTERVRVNNQMLSLDDIEHGIFRPKFNDFRAHFAFNCGAKGCPNLAAQAFTGRTLEAQLNAAARAFINHPRGVHLQDGRLTLSKIFDWYRADFVAEEEALPLFLAPFAEPILGAQLTNYSGRIDYEYDWSLNEASPSL